MKILLKNLKKSKIEKFNQNFPKIKKNFVLQIRKILEKNTEIFDDIQPFVVFDQDKDVYDINSGNAKVIKENLAKKLGEFYDILIF